MWVWGGDLGVFDQVGVFKGVFCKIKSVHFLISERFFKIKVAFLYQYLLFQYYDLRVFY